jgi:hypothetical protein
MRQAAILFKFAKVTKDPTISAALLEKAADLKSQVDETMPPPSDWSPRPPDRKVLGFGRSTVTTPARIGIISTAAPGSDRNHRDRDS